MKKVFCNTCAHRDTTKTRPKQCGFPPNIKEIEYNSWESGHTTYQYGDCSILNRDNNCKSYKFYWNQIIIIAVCCLCMLGFIIWAFK